MIKTLCFSGGSMKGVAFLGALAYLQETEQLAHVEACIGTSIGALAALMFVTDTHNTIFPLFLQEYTKLLPRYSLTTLTRLYGLDNMSAMRRFITEHILGGDAGTTFKTLFERAPTKLSVVATSMVTKTATIFNHIETPDVLVIDAVLASAAIPFVYTPIVIDGVHYLDGGLVCHFPITHCDPASTLGLYLYSEPQSANVGKLSVYQFALHVFDIVFYHSENTMRQNYGAYKVHEIIFQDKMSLKFLDLKHSKETLKSIYDLGYNSF